MQSYLLVSPSKSIVSVVAAWHIYKKKCLKYISEKQNYIIISQKYAEALYTIYSVLIKFLHRPWLGIKFVRSELSLSSRMYGTCQSGCLEWARGRYKCEEDEAITAGLRQRACCGGRRLYIAYDRVLGTVIGQVWYLTCPLFLLTYFISRIIILLE